MTRLQEQIADLHDLYEQIAELVFEKEAGSGDDGAQHMKVSHSAFPGSSRHWSWLVGVRSGTRHAEGDLEVFLSYNHVYRSDSDRNTHASLSRLVLLVEASSGRCPRTPPEASERDEQGVVRVSHGLVCAGVGYVPHVVEAVVDRWHRSALELLDEQEPLQRVPEPEGQPVLCPICGNRSLRWRPKARQMFCVAPSCRQEWGPDDLEWLASTTYESEAS